MTEAQNTTFAETASPGAATVITPIIDNVIHVTNYNGHYTGTNGNDAFLFDSYENFFHFRGIIDGLGGNDTIRLF